MNSVRRHSHPGTESRVTRRRIGPHRTSGIDRACNRSLNRELIIPLVSAVSSDGVAVTVAGSDPPPPAEDLADALAKELERPIHLTITVVPETVIEVDSEG